jgi:hypothetical protein
MLSALSAENVEFLVVGAYAMAAHGCVRATGDLDIWIRPLPENADRVWRALTRFRAPLFDLTKDDLVNPDIVFQIGIAPNRIDLLTAIDGVGFDEAWEHRKTVVVEGRSVAALGRDQLIKNKKATGRPKDLFDVQWLQTGGGEDKNLGQA